MRLSRSSAIVSNAALDCFLPDTSAVVLLAQNGVGDTALHVAARARQMPACRLLLSLGASRSAVNDEGRTAAEEARDLGFVDLADWLDTTRCGLDDEVWCRLV